MQQWGRWYSQAPVGGRYFRNKKKEVNLPKDEKRFPRTERPTHPPRTTQCTLHPPTDQTFTTYSSTAAALRTAVHLVRGEQLVGWFLRTLFETGNKRGEFHFSTILSPSRGVSEPSSTTHLPPTIHRRTYPVQQHSNAAVHRAMHLTGEQQPIRWLQCSRAARDLGSSEPSPGGRFPRAPPAEVGHRRPFFRRHVVVLLCRWDVAAPRGRRRQSGARESQFFGGGFITKIFSRIQKNATTTTLAFVLNVPEPLRGCVASTLLVR